MQIQPVKFNQPAFNGTVQVKNLTNGVTKDYKISQELDKKLITAYKNNLAADPFLYGMQVFEKEKITNGLKSYINTLSEVTGDSFIKELPQVEAKSNNYFAKFTNNNYSQLTTDGYEITHDLNA